jgi:hypothetical protein
MYSKIANPETGRFVKVNSLLGKRIINNYIQSGGIKIAKTLAAATLLSGSVNASDPRAGTPPGWPAAGTEDRPGRAAVAVDALAAQEKNWAETQAANRRFHQPLAYPTELDMVPQHDPAAASYYGTGNKYYSASTSVDDESVNNWRGGPIEDTSGQARAPSIEELDIDWSVLDPTSLYAKSLLSRMEAKQTANTQKLEQEPTERRGQLLADWDEVGRRAEPDRAPRGGLFPGLSWETLAGAVAYFTR